MVVIFQCMLESSNGLHKTSMAWHRRESSSFISRGMSNGGSSSRGHTLNKITLLPHTSRGSYSGLPLTNGIIHISVGRGTACKSRPSKRSKRPVTAGTIESCTSRGPSYKSAESDLVSDAVVRNNSPPVGPFDDTVAVVIREEWTGEAPVAQGTRSDGVFAKSGPHVTVVR
ncbi:hypothetical protein ACHAXA_000436 [Cyclostephanos tholiformis]|uniref:Uncharacterized protein n=1 Tax=Cyclostephanos tholiformis TaxID=382380 RepID=A0ABD3RVY5_9STRA